MGRHVIKNSYEYLYARLLTNAGQIHEKNRRRVKIGFILMVLSPVIMEGVRRFAHADRTAFLIGWVIFMFSLAAYLITVDFLDYSMQEKLKEMTEKEEGFDALLGSPVKKYRIRRHSAASGRGTTAGHSAAPGNTLRAIVTEDYRRLTGNVVALVILIGLCVVPCLYAWFNILSNWDPYEPDATGNIPFAVYSVDQGVTVGDSKINIGDMVIDKIKGNDAMGWVFTESKKEAIDGVKSGKYYAAMIIPKHFSEDITSFTGDTLTHPKIRYYENDKKNAIAPKITGKGKSAFQKEMNDVFVNVLGQATVELSASSQEEGRSFGEQFSDIGDSLGRLSNTLADSIVLVDAASSLSKSGGSMLDASGALLQSAQKTLDTGRTELEDTKADLPADIHVSDLADTAAGEADRLSGELDRLSGEFEDLSEALSESEQDPARYNAFLPERRGQIMAEIEAMVQKTESTKAALAGAGLTRLSERFARIKERLEFAKVRLAGLTEATQKNRERKKARLFAIHDALQTAGQEAHLIVKGRQEAVSDRLSEAFRLVRESPAGQTKVASKINNRIEQKAKRKQQRKEQRKERIFKTAEAISREVSELRSAIRQQRSAVSAARKNKKAYRAFIEEKRDKTKNRILTVRNRVKGIHDRLLDLGLTALAERMAGIASRIDKAQQHLDLLEAADMETREDAYDTLDTICDVLESAEQEMDFIVSEQEDRIDEKLNDALASTKNAISDMEEVVSASHGDLEDLRQTLSTAKQSLLSLDRGLGGTKDVLLSAQSQSREMSGEFLTLSRQDVFSDMTHLAKLDAKKVAKKLSTPIGMRTETIYPVDHYGSSMAAFYTVLAQGVGALFAAVLIRAHTNVRDPKKAPGLLTRYVARYLLYVTVGIV